MEVKLVLTADDKLLQAIESLTKAVVGLSIKDPLPGVTVSAPKQETTSTEIVKEKPNNEVKEETKTNKTEHLKVTIEMVRAKAAELNKSGKQKELKAIFQNYGASKLSEISENDYLAVFEDLKKELGEV